MMNTAEADSAEGMYNVLYTARSLTKRYDAQSVFWLHIGMHTTEFLNPNSSGIFSSISAVAWCAKKHTAECALKHNAKNDVTFV